MRRINYKSDFDFVLRLRDCRGEAVGWPGYDWRAKFWTASKVNSFEASCVGGVCRNCFDDGGVIHIVADGHGLTPGRLNVEFVAELPNGIYSDTRKRVVVPSETDVELVSGAAGSSHVFDIDIEVPAVDGLTGGPGAGGSVGGGITEEQIAELTEGVLGRANEYADNLVAKANRKADRYATNLVTTASGNVLNFVKGLIPLTAQPGVVYRYNPDDGVRIKLSVPAIIKRNISDGMEPEVTYDLSGYYYDKGDGRLIPLAEAVAGVGYNNPRAEYGYELTDNVVTLKVADYGYLSTVIPFLMLKDQIGTEANHYNRIHLRIDKQGRKVFRLFIAPEPPAGELAPLKVDKMSITPDSKDDRFAYLRHRRLWKMEVCQWRHNRRKIGADKRHEINKWQKTKRGAFRFSPATRTVFLKVRGVSRSGLKTPWMYLHCKRKDDILDRWVINEAKYV